MVLNKGGYVMINKAQDNVYELATSALTSGKPILWYETNTECYFIDTVKLSGTDIILTKGGKTITIENDGDITENDDIQTHLCNFYSSSVYLQTTDYGDIRGMWEFTAIDDDYYINAYDFITIKNGLEKILNKCGIINIINSDSDTEFTGSIYKRGDDIIIEGYSSSKNAYLSFNLNDLSNDTNLELITNWTKKQLF